MRWTDEYLRDVCPYVTVAIMSCAHLSEDEREREMKKAQKYGVSVVLELSEKKALMYYIKINFYIQKQYWQRML